MKAFLKFVAVLAILAVAIFFSGKLVLPDAVVVDRHVAIDAPPEEVFAAAADLKRFKEWSPWAAADPGIVYTFDGAPGGVGQKMSWTSGTPGIGSGSQTITALDSNQRVVSELDLAGLGKGVATISLAPISTGTGVTWHFQAPVDSTFGRWALLFNPPPLDAAFGQGLRRLKALLEKPAT